MNRKIFCLALCALLFALCVPADAQRQTKVPKIGLLRARLIASGTSLDALVRELRAIGYVEGKNIAFESRSAENKLDRLPTLADELVRLNVDVIIAAAMEEALAAKSVTRTIPILFLGGGDPVAGGLVDSLARPGGNITGSLTFRRSWLANGLSCSRKRFPSSPALRCCGIRWFQALPNNGKKTSYRQENWACSFIPWKSAASTSSKACLLRRLKQGAALSSWPGARWPVLIGNGLRSWR